MKTQILRFCLVVSYFSAYVSPVKALEWWRRVGYLIYSSRYFGPNAFPVPELVGGSLSGHWEVELRGEYHRVRGDQTRDISTRLCIPVVEGHVGVSVSWVFREWYEMSPGMWDERYAIELESPIVCWGNVIFDFYSRALQSEKWMDIVVSTNLKTANGRHLRDARYTGAAFYWFDANLGRTLWKRRDVNASIRAQTLAGFYRWMTNDVANRQNDVFCHGAGVLRTHREFPLNCNYAGFQGYRDNGDKPMVLRIKLNHELRKNILSFQYRHGMKDHLYDSYSLAYIRYF